MAFSCSTMPVEARSVVAARLRFLAGPSLPPACLRHAHVRRAFSSSTGPQSVTVPQGSPLRQSTAAAAHAAGRRQAPSSPGEGPRLTSAYIKKNFDVSLWRYLPWWLQPPSILGSGAALFCAAVALDTQLPPAKAAVIAAGPLALYYVIFLMVVPREFTRFTIRYMKEHPELGSPAAATSPQTTQDDA